MNLSLIIIIVSLPGQHLVTTALEKPNISVFHYCYYCTTEFALERRQPPQTGGEFYSNAFGLGSKLKTSFCKAERVLIILVSIVYGMESVIIVIQDIVQYLRSALITVLFPV